MSAAFRLLVAQLVVLLPLAATTWVAVSYSLYWRLWWLDIPMHFFGGAWAALSIAWILVRRGERFTLASCLLFALLVGIGWEIFEYAEGVAFPHRISYEIDTFKDVVVDLVGAAAGFVLATRLVRAHRR